MTTAHEYMDKQASFSSTIGKMIPGSRINKAIQTAKAKKFSAAERVLNSRGTTTPKNVGRKTKEVKKMYRAMKNERRIRKV